MLEKLLVKSSFNYEAYLALGERIAKYSLKFFSTKYRRCTAAV
jgi:hypothetical protein